MTKNLSKAWFTPSINRKGPFKQFTQAWTSTTQASFFTPLDKILPLYQEGVGGVFTLFKNSGIYFFNIFPSTKREGLSVLPLYQEGVGGVFFQSNPQLLSKRHPYLA